VVLVSKPGLRVAKQDWSTLTLEAHPHYLCACASRVGVDLHHPDHGRDEATMVTRRSVVERGMSGARTELQWTTTRGGGSHGSSHQTTTVQLQISNSGSNSTTSPAPHEPTRRAWLVRVHLRRGQCLVDATLSREDLDDGAGASASATLSPPVHLPPLRAHELWGFAPFGGAGRRRPPP
jgi:hypothetical protein